MRESDKQRIQRLKSAGRCVHHKDRFAVPGKLCCQSCLTANAKQTAKRAAKLKKIGKCPVHPRRFAVSGHVLCRKCLDRMRSSEQHRVYNGIRRARLRTVQHESVNTAIVVERDLGICRHCGKLCGKDAQADHIIPISLGGPHTYWNHQCLCSTCNKVKKNDIRKEPRLSHLLHLKIPALIETFAKEQAA